MVLPQAGWSPAPSVVAPRGAGSSSHGWPPAWTGQEIGRCATRPRALQSRFTAGILRGIPPGSHEDVMTTEHVDTFQDSVQRCLQSPSFIKDFYDRFTGTSEEIRAKFRTTDFVRQHRAMADSLRVMALAVQGGPDNLARQEMKRLAAGHQVMHIDAWMYDVWLDCMLHTARVHDPQFSDAVEGAWRETLAPAIETMRAGVPFAT